MPETLAPSLKKIAVSYDKLVLDPNNPRFITRKEDRVSEEQFLAYDLTGRTSKKMLPGKDDPYQIAQLVNSIKQNGWLPVDCIFVRKMKLNDGHYVVLEGNRRVSAIRKIMEDNGSPAHITDSLQQIEVMEVLDNGSNEDLQKRITYLLGVRHHGSLRRWTPFAQARNIFNLYLEKSGQTPNTFVWIEDRGKQIADTLSIPWKVVNARLMVYRAMRQIGESSEMAGAEGKMEDQYFSITSEPLFRKGFREYIQQDQETFLLDEASVQRMVNLCHFNKRLREDAPVNEPTEWRALEKILSDEVPQKREAMLKQVEVEKLHPSDIWAERLKEITEYKWDRWLLEVKSVLQQVTVAELTQVEASRPVIQQLLTLLSELDTLDSH